MKFTRKKILKTCLFAIASFIFVFIILYALHRPSLIVVAEWQQPANITYDNQGPYYLSVVETDINWRGFPIYVKRNHIIYAGRESGTPSHGHVIEYSFHAFPDNLKDFLKKATVDWTPDGVTLVLPSGHRLFVPKNMFMGGR